MTDMELTMMTAERGLKATLAHIDYTRGFRCGLERKFDGAHLAQIFNAEFARGFHDALKIPADVREQLLKSATA